MGSVSDITPNSFQDTNYNNSSFQSNSYQQLLEQKATPFSNSFLMNRPLPNLSNPNPFANYSSKNLPILVLPTNVNTSSSMVVNTNLITKSSSSSTASTSNQSEPESRPSPFEFQTSKTAQEHAKPSVNSAASNLFSNYFPNASNPFQSTPLIQVPTPITNLNQANQSQFSQIQPAFGMLPNKGNQITSQASVFNTSSQNGSMNLNGPFISAFQNLYSYPINNMTALNSMGSLNQMNSYNMMNSGVRSTENPMQIQYLTSLYLPYSNNNIYNNCYPMMYSNGPEMCIQGQMQPQRNLNNLMPATGVAFNSH